MKWVKIGGGKGTLAILRLESRSRVPASNMKRVLLNPVPTATPPVLVSSPMTPLRLLTANHGSIFTTTTAPPLALRLAFVLYILYIPLACTQFEWLHL